MKRSFVVIALGVSALFGSGRTWDDEWRITPADDSVISDSRLIVSSREANGA